MLKLLSSLSEISEKHNKTADFISMLKLSLKAQPCFSQIPVTLNDA